ncbi:MAG: hypothetical protein HY261_10755, partial [Chloroflexi bacterium]|nr:hypothetical protein [Chloroflexota bacterium]
AKATCNVVVSIQSNDTVNHRELNNHLLVTYGDKDASKATVNDVLVTAVVRCETSPYKSDSNKDRRVDLLDLARLGVRYGTDTNYDADEKTLQGEYGQACS